MNGDVNNRLYGQSPGFLRAVHAARILGTADAPVLITGEAGVGKEALAREIHRSGRWRARPFVRLACAELTGETLAGLLRDPGGAASAGVLYFSEVADLSADAQAQLLALADRLDGRPPGGAPRLIASTSRDLPGLAEQGRFRKDLYFRLNVVPLEVPPLRERAGDVALLLKLITCDVARAHGRRAPGYSVTAKNLLKAYRWPGNVRELRNLCERMVLLHAGERVQPEDLPAGIRRRGDERRGMPLFRLPEGGVDFFSLEADLIRQALEMAGGNRSKAARLLGLSRDTLLYRIQKHAIEV